MSQFLNVFKTPLSVDICLQETEYFNYAHLLF